MFETLEEVLAYLPTSGINDFQLLDEPQRLVLGRVNAWGRILEHEKGLRCQFMQATEFVDPRSIVAPKLPVINVTSFGETMSTWSPRSIPLLRYDALREISMRYDAPIAVAV
jgi:hypothetical protein